MSDVAAPLQDERAREAWPERVHRAGDRSRTERPHDGDRVDVGHGMSDDVVAFTTKSSRNERQLINEVYVRGNVATPARNSC